MAGSTWVTFSASTTASAAQVNSNFDWLEGDIVPMSNGALANGQFNLGTATAAFRAVYLDANTSTDHGSIFFAGTSSAFLTSNILSSTNQLVLGHYFANLVPNTSLVQDIGAAGAEFNVRVGSPLATTSYSWSGSTGSTLHTHSLGRYGNIFIGGQGTAGSNASSWIPSAVSTTSILIAAPEWAGSRGAGTSFLQIW